MRMATWNLMFECLLPGAWTVWEGSGVVLLGVGCAISKPAPGLSSLSLVGQNVELPAIAPAPCVSASCCDDL